MDREAARVLIPISFVPGADRTILVPEYATEGSSGLDLRANLDLELRSTGVAILESGVQLIGTGIMLAIPKGVEGQVRSRSGLALRHSVAVLNSPGTIDSDYRGEISVVLINHGKTRYTIKHGDRIAQIVFRKVLNVEFEERDTLESTARGAGGYGSSDT